MLDDRESEKEDEREARNLLKVKEEAMARSSGVFSGCVLHVGRQVHADVMTSSWESSVIKKTQGRG